MRFDHRDREFRLSVVVERIWCHGSDNHLVLEGQGFEQDSTTRSIKLCMNDNNSNDGWQSVDNILDNVIIAEVRAEGDWSNEHENGGLYAQLIVSIYHGKRWTVGVEIVDEISFCCGLTSRNRDEQVRARVRCIPSVGVCNRHPNCGMFSNEDEAQNTCSPKDEELCMGPDCHLAEVALRIAVLVLVCFLLPPTLILFACRFKASRRFCDRLTNRINNESTGSGRNPAFCSRHGHHRHQEQTVVAATYNAEDDQPPSYEDFLRSNENLNLNLVPVSVIPVKEVPPPTFDQAMMSESAGVNPAYVFNDEELIESPRSS